MKIDWFTILAQALNFIILVWLLKRYLYKPILDAIDAREKKISAELAGAAKKKAEAKKEGEEYQAKSHKFDQERAQLLSQATDDAKAERQRLLDEASKAAVELGAKRKESLQAEEKNMRQSVSLRIQAEVFAVTRKALNDLADANIEDQMVNVFCRRLGALGEDERKPFIGDAHGDSKPAVVQTASPLPPDLRALTESAVKRVCGPKTKVSFEIKPELISGIELIANDHQAGWNVSDYLTSLEASVDGVKHGV